MSNKFENKFRKVSESVTLELSLDNYILLPDSKVKCNIVLRPKYNIKLGKPDQEIIIKLRQFQKCEYQKDEDESSTNQKAY